MKSETVVPGKSCSLLSAVGIELSYLSGDFLKSQKFKNTWIFKGKDCYKLWISFSQTLTLFDSHPTGIQISELRAPVLHKRPLKLSSPETETSYLSPKIPKLFKEEKDATLKKVILFSQNNFNILKCQEYHTIRILCRVSFL